MTVRTTKGASIQVGARQDRITLLIFYLPERQSQKLFTGVVPEADTAQFVNAENSIGGVLKKLMQDARFRVLQP